MAQVAVDRLVSHAEVGHRVATRRGAAYRRLCDALSEAPLRVLGRAFPDAAASRRARPRPALAGRGTRPLRERSRTRGTGHRHRNGRVHQDRRLSGAPRGLVMRATGRELASWRRPEVPGSWSAPDWRRRRYGRSLGGTPHDAGGPRTPRHGGWSSSSCHGHCAHPDRVAVRIQCEPGIQTPLASANRSRTRSSLSRALAVVRSGSRSSIERTGPLPR